MLYPTPIAKLIDSYSKLPGIGIKTATRLAFYTIGMSDDDVNEFAKNLLSAKRELTYCSICGRLTDDDPCSICTDPTRDQTTILVLEDSRDVAAMGKNPKKPPQVYADAGRQELADQELAEVAVLEEYQPTQLTDDEVTTLVQAAITDVAAGGDISMKLMGPVMQQVTKTAAGRADGKRLSAAVRAALQ